MAKAKKVSRRRAAIRRKVRKVMRWPELTMDDLGLPNDFATVDPEVAESAPPPAPGGEG